MLVGFTEPFQSLLCTGKCIIPYPIENVIFGASKGTNYAIIRCCPGIDHWSSLPMTVAFNRCPPEKPQDILILHVRRRLDSPQPVHQDSCANPRAFEAQFLQTQRPFPATLTAPFEPCLRIEDSLARVGRTRTDSAEKGGVIFPECRTELFYQDLKSRPIVPNNNSVFPPTNENPTFSKDCISFGIPECNTIISI